MDISKVLDWNDKEGMKNLSSLVVSLMLVLLVEFFAAPDFIQSFLRFLLLGGLPPEHSTERLAWMAFRVIVLAIPVKEAIFRVLKPLEKGAGWLIRLPEVLSYQAQFPSRYLMQRCQDCGSPCSLSVADNPARAGQTWFTFFNEFPADVRERTFSRGYVCYLVFLIQYASLVLAFVGFLVTTVLYLWAQYLPLAGLVYSFVLLLLGLILRATNCPSLDNPTGVWREFAEINNVHKEWLRQNENQVRRKMCEAPSAES